MKVIHFFKADYFCFLVQQILYSRIAVTLWKSSRGLERHMAMQSNACSSSASAMTSNFIRNASKKYEKRAVGVTDSQVMYIS